MTHEDETNLETQLREATHWNDPPPVPPLWMRAMERSANDRGVGRIARSMLLWPAPKAIAAAIGILLIAAFAAALLLPDIGEARLVGTGSSIHSSMSLPAQAPPPLSGFDSSPSMNLNGALNQMPELHSAVRMDGYYSPQELFGIRNPGEDGTLGGGGPAREIQSVAAPSSAPPNDRAVIRKATLELITNDVRAGFIKAMHVISEAGGEYVQDSSITGEGNNAQANVTLRVAAERLPSVLNELREFGKVQAERIAGEDVTTQLVDLDARLRNEQRVEKELLELLDRRADAPLKEILELRTQISNVRQIIEQLAAQQERLGRHVALATIIVIIRPEPDPQPEMVNHQSQSLFEYFVQSVSESWAGGLRFLADSLAGTLKVIVGGLMWWIILILALLALRQHLQRRVMQ